MFGFFAMVILIIGVLGPISVFLRVKCRSLSSRRASAMGVLSFGTRRNRTRDRQNQNPQRKSLVLESWRKHLQEDSKDFGPIELRGCYFQAPAEVSISSQEHCDNHEQSYKEEFEREHDLEQELDYTGMDSDNEEYENVEVVASRQVEMVVPFVVEKE